MGSCPGRWKKAERKHWRGSEDGMTPVQKLEMRRFTHCMWTLIRYAGKMHPLDAELFGPVLRTARILERRGFLSVTNKDKVCLTAAGHEAWTILRQKNGE
jgi:hypothetical protein